MVKQIRWSHRAQNDRREILEYWQQRNKSDSYSKKLDELFKRAVLLVAEYPQIGRQTDQPDTRVKIVKDYLIIYEETSESINILTVWDSRQNPEELKKATNYRK